MVYATGRRYLDADSHLMELPGWLAAYAEPGIRERIRPLELGGAGALAEDAVARAQTRAAAADTFDTADIDVMRAKGWHGFGAFDPAERSRALDLLGFDAQLVFSTFAATQFAGDDLELLYGGARAHNRAMTDFSANDARLLPVGFVPWNDPALALETVDDAIELGCAAILFPSRPPRRGKSITHPDFDPMWQALEDAEVPFVLHVGGAGRLTPREFHDNGHPVTDFLGGGENIRAKDYMGIAHMTELFLASLIFDGVLERFPRLRGGSIEQGAMWVVAWLRRLDLAQLSFGRNEPTLRDLPMRPSEYVRGRLFFTPFPGEPVGWMVEQCGEELFCFSSDFPHPEGTKDPIGRFEAALAGASEDAKERFYSSNLEQMLGA